MEQKLDRASGYERIRRRVGDLWPEWVCVGLLILAFVVSRRLAVEAGVATGGLPHLQVADRDLLRADLLRTLLLLHIQPPLFNGVLGLLLRAPLAFSKAVSISYQGMGILLSVTMFFLLRRLRVSRTLACFATLLFVLSPACILYETFTIYTYPCALILLATTYFVHRYSQFGGRGNAIAVSLLVASAALIRSLLHLFWAMGGLVLVWLLPRPEKRRSLWLVVPALGLVAVVFLKNLVLFDTFGTSTLIGQSLYRISTQVIDLEVRLRLVEEGRITPFALMAPSRPVAHYPLQPQTPERIEIGSWEARAFLAQGWSRKPEGKGQFRWSTAARSILVLPVTEPEDLDIKVRVAPFRFPDAPRQSMAVRVAGEAVAEIELRTPVLDYEVPIPSRLLRSGLNTVTFVYGYSKSPRELGLSRDPRTLAVRWYSVDIGSSSRVSDSAGLTMKPPFADRPWTAEAPVLTRILKVDGGSNPNHALMPQLMKVYRRDALTLIREFPLTYLRSVGRAWLISMAPPTEHPAFQDKRRRIERWDRLYSAAVYGALNRFWGPEHSHDSRWRTTGELLRRVSWHYVLAGLVLIPWSLRRWFQNPRDPDSVTLLFALFCIGWVMGVGNLLDYGENNRFRMLVEPLIWVVLVTALSQGMRAVAARFRVGRRGDPGIPAGRGRAGSANRLSIAAPRSATRPRPASEAWTSRSRRRLHQGRRLPGSRCARSTIPVSGTP